MIRTYNSQNTIQRALDSAINQTLSPDLYRILVVDDGSSDQTLDIVQRYKNIDVLLCDHRGAVQVLNSALKKATTPYFILLDSDDCFEPRILEKQYNALLRDPSIDFVYCDYYEVINGIKKIVSVKDNLFHTLAAGIMHSMKLIRLHGYYDETLVFPEYDFLMKILPTARGYHIPEPLYTYYRMDTSLTSKKDLVQKGRKQLFDRYGKQLSIRDF
ncbi:MAG: glycosyltransferase family 2 protein [Candidatus Thorarchaeota archaeon]|nr:glycosyltransferase family 2 protein [Candidatus Thorarchaeota archaeon]